MEEDEERLCVFKDLIYGFCYEKGGSYGYDIEKAIMKHGEFPEHIKKDKRLTVIFLDTKQGLETLAEEGFKIPAKVLELLTQEKGEIFNKKTL